MPRDPDGRTVLTDPDTLNSCNRPVAARWHLVPFIPDTNAIEALNRQLRKAIKTKGHFPNEDAARKLIYLAVTNAVPAWTRTRNWTIALLAFKIHFGDRLPDAAS
jgi:transposase-like protein